MTLELYIQFWADIFHFWWPVILLSTISIIYLYFDERRDKQNKKAHLAATRKGQ